MSAEDPFGGPAATPVLLEGRIQTPPGGLTDPVGVVLIDDYDPGIELDDCLWMPRGDLLPGYGDLCLVAHSPTRAWVVVWWPYDAD